MKRKELLSAAVSGLTITLGNPKTIAFYLALLPLVINLETVSLATWGLMLVPLTVLVLLSVGALFVFGAVRIRHLLSSLRATAIVSRCRRDHGGSRCGHAGSLRGVTRY